MVSVHIPELLLSLIKFDNPFYEYAREGLLWEG